MTSKATGIGGFLAPIWREVSSLWSGAEFAFLDQPSAEMEESPASDFYDLTSTGSHAAMEAGQFGHCS